MFARTSVPSGLLSATQHCGTSPSAEVRPRRSILAFPGLTKGVILATLYLDLVEPIDLTFLGHSSSYYFPCPQKLIEYHLP